MQRFLQYKGVLIAAALLTLLLAGCSGGDNDNSTADNADTENGEDKPAPVIPVEVIDVTRGDVFAAYSGSASLEALEEATVVAKVGGEVREIRVEEGDMVERNDVLARLDGDRLRLALEQSRANLAKLQREYDRSVELNKKGIVAASAFETQKYELDALKAAFKMAELEYRYTTIRAPISGVISRRDIKVGNTIEPNAPTFGLTALDPLVAYLFIPEREFGRIAADQPVRMRIDALPGEEFVGNIARISPVVDAESGTFKATVEVTETSGRLKPGMFGRFSIIFDQQRDAMLLPRDALIETSSGSSVFAVRDGVAKRLSVETGYTWNEQVAILSGVEDADRVVVVGQPALKDGTKVRIVGEEPGEAEAEADMATAAVEEGSADD